MEICWFLTFKFHAFCHTLERILVNLLILNGGMHGNRGTLKSAGLRLKFLGVCTTLVSLTLRFAGIHSTFAPGFRLRFVVI